MPVRTTEERIAVIETEVAAVKDNLSEFKRNTDHNFAEIKRDVSGLRNAIILAAISVSTSAVGFSITMLVVFR